MYFWTFLLNSCKPHKCWPLYYYINWEAKVPLLIISDKQPPASGMEWPIICYFTVIDPQVSLTFSDAVSSGVVKVDSWTINKRTQSVSNGVSVNHMTNAQSKLYSWQNSLFSVYSGVLYAHVYCTVGLFIVLYGVCKNTHQ